MPACIICQEHFDWPKRLIQFTCDVASTSLYVLYMPVADTEKVVVDMMMFITFHHFSLSMHYN